MERVWDVLAAHGAPLTVMKQGNDVVGEASLIEALLAAVDDLADHPDQTDVDRKNQALASLLLALRDHYPDVFKTLPAKVRARIPDPVEGRHIKMRRMASARLAVYL